MSILSIGAGLHCAAGSQQVFAGDGFESGQSYQRLGDQLVPGAAGRRRARAAAAAARLLLQTR